MPSRKVHEWFDKLLVGKKMTHVHRFMDYPSKFLGSKHRVLFHGPEIPILYLSMGKPKEALSSIGHIFLDKTINSKAAKIMEMFL